MNKSLMDKTRLDWRGTREQKKNYQRNYENQEESKNGTKNEPNAVA